MIESMSSASSLDVANAERFERVGAVADPVSVAHIREQFAEWLGTYLDVDAELTSDLLLAVNEALANVAEYAYLCSNRPGTVDLRVSHDPRRKRLAVTVADQGSWRMPDPDPENRTRGRGIPLMRTLADRANIETSPDGTVVRMEWHGVRRLKPPR
jgi:serine/threonine-protein kinase RsbW